MIVFVIQLFDFRKMISQRRFSTRLRKNDADVDADFDAEADVDPNADNSETKKRFRGGKWTQEETEKLVSLLLEHGKKGILNKTTNAMKNVEWTKVHTYFNSSKLVINYCTLCVFFGISEYFLCL